MHVESGDLPEFPARVRLLSLPSLASHVLVAARAVDGLSARCHAGSTTRAAVVADRAFMRTALGEFCPQVTLGLRFYFGVSPNCAVVAIDLALISMLLRGRTRKDYTPETGS